MIGLVKLLEPEVLQQNKVAWTAEFAADSSSRRYAHEEIRATLRDETSRKCAYCESHVEHVSYVHVEHILPKSIFPALVVEWENLTLACQKCNVEKGDDFDAVCLLLNPYADDPDDHLYWLGPMLMSLSPDRGRRTISKIDLNRAELLFKRAERIEHAKGILHLMDGASDAVRAALTSDLARLVAPGAEFSAAVRSFLASETRV